MEERNRRIHGERAEVINGGIGEKKEKKDVADYTQKIQTSLTTTEPKKGLWEKIKRAGLRIKEIWEKIISKDDGFGKDIVDPATANLGTIESDISKGGTTVDGAYKFANEGKERIQQASIDNDVMEVLQEMPKLDDRIMEEIIVNDKSPEK